MAIEPNTAPVPAAHVQTGGWFSVFTVLGICAAFLVLLIADCAWIEKYQTLIAGVMALLGAIVTVFVLWKQIRQGEMHHREHREKKFAAARAVSTLALSDLCGYAEESLQYAAKGRKLFEHAENSNDDSIVITDNPPSIPENLIPVLRDLVEYGDAGISSVTCDLISQIQIHYSRMLSLPKAKETQPLSGAAGKILHYSNVFDCRIRDSAKLYAFAANFFKYARFKTSALPKSPTREEVDGRLNIMYVYENDFPIAFALIDETE